MAERSKNWPVKSASFSGSPTEAENELNAVPPEVAILSPVPVNPPFDVVYTVEPGQPLTLTGSLDVAGRAPRTSMSA